MKHEICKLSEIPEAGSRVISFFGREIHVWRNDGRIHAASNTCMHFGGPLECKNGELVCQWHGARFSMADGWRTEGPAPRDSRLMFLSTRVEEDALHYVWGEPA